jgi:ABC-type transport system substrate-binding protein
MQINSTGRWWTLAAVLALPVLALTLAAQQTSSLVVSGQQGEAKVIQVEGRNYVEVEGLARLTNGSVSFTGNRILLTIPGFPGNAPAAPAAAPSFSKDFLNAGIEAMARVREWHTALRTAVERGIPVSADWLGAYQAQAQDALRLASVAINTESDKNAYPFLTNEFNNMRNLGEKYVQITKSMDYTAPGSLQSDPLDQRIVTCAHSLASMVTSNQIVDDGSCQ